MEPVGGAGRQDAETGLEKEAASAENRAGTDVAAAAAAAIKGGEAARAVAPPNPPTLELVGSQFSGSWGGAEALQQLSNAQEFLNLAKSTTYTDSGPLSVVDAGIWNAEHALNFKKDSEYDDSSPQKKLESLSAAATQWQENWEIKKKNGFGNVINLLDRLLFRWTPWLHSFSQIGRAETVLKAIEKLKKLPKTQKEAEDNIKVAIEFITSQGNPLLGADAREGLINGLSAGGGPAPKNAVDYLVFLISAAKEDWENQPWTCSIASNNSYRYKNSDGKQDDAKYEALMEKKKKLFEVLKAIHDSPVLTKDQKDEFFNRTDLILADNAEVFPYKTIFNSDELGELGITLTYSEKISLLEQGSNHVTFPELTSGQHQS